MVNKMQYHGSQRFRFRAYPWQKGFLWIVVGLVAIAAVLPARGWAQPSPDSASPSRRTRPEDIWKLVYQQLPDLPLENQYVNRKTNRVDTDNTLIGRLIRYHLYIKGRSPIYRFDWKMTLADYFGINEVIPDSTYPGATTLKQNPIEGDRAALDRLNRAQREALVQVLVDVFTPQTTLSLPAPAPAPVPPQRTRPKSLDGFVP